MNFFQNMISSIMKRTLRLDSLGLKDFGVLHKDLIKTTESIMSTTGEVSTLVYSEHLLDLWRDSVGFNLWIEVLDSLAFVGDEELSKVPWNLRSLSFSSIV